VETLFTIAGIRNMAHLAAVLPHHTMMEVIEAGRNLVLRTQPEILDGFLILSDAPGAGVEFDAQALERHRVAGTSGTTLAAAYARAGDAGQVG
jgi:L-alanine-DL-glutamate epimerase-like enolase superfamily enzyme